MIITYSFIGSWIHQNVELISAVPKKELTYGGKPFRLPIIQGGCAKFIPAVAALMSIDRLRCNAQIDTTVTGRNQIER